jgi:serine/threonine protein kinase
MGVVYLATDLTLDRQVALKLIAGSVASEEEFRARFERECRVAASIDHPTSSRSSTPARKGSGCT